MEPINLADVEPFIGALVEIIIQDEQGGDQAAAVRKTIKEVQYCPDKTHIRFYFDHFYFLAVPLTSKITQSDEVWAAFDAESGLTYTLKKVQVL
ncbi:hypothetical protein FB550_11311 [Neobacillus bataviensis]|uniref:Uncharacterized protein n=1 Tax=Neobacillus bataviensis TaxID=220685 RepID=A0A561CTC1_9BACI|nr:hypothetical protein [Neobacillus bataviensis]TWD94479.1 hypothetical protein FB550_11311 [Neobacillus bataviensis]